jgi:hypothetical protein
MTTVTSLNGAGCGEDSTGRMARAVRHVATDARHRRPTAQRGDCRMSTQPTAPDGREISIKPVDGTNHMFASPDGRVFTDYRGPMRERSCLVDCDGYRSTTIHYSNGVRKRVRVYQVIAGLFLEKPPGVRLEICHKNDVKTDDRADNLYWGTHLQNLHDALKNGCLKSRVTSAMLESISVSLSTGASQNSVAKSHGISPTYLSQILSGERRNTVFKRPSLLRAAGCTVGSARSLTGDREGKL